jgi:tripartite-type tricarboxylate transporter receptor subunit TctC
MPFPYGSRGATLAIAALAYGTPPPDINGVRGTERAEDVLQPSGSARRGRGRPTTTYFVRVAQTAHAAEPYPAKPVRFIVGFPPGGATDLVARIAQPKLSAGLGQQVVVDNRPGANGTISLALLAQAQPDGYTVAFGHIGGLVISPAIQKVQYDPARDFAAIGLMVTLQNILITHPGLPAATLKDFIALAKSRQGQLNYASSGVGSPGHLAGVLLETLTETPMTHIPYKGGGPAITDLLAGHVPSFFAVISTAVPHVQAKRIHALGVTGERRSPALPDVPTIAEAGVPGYLAVNWYGLVAPAGTPPAIVARLGKDMTAALRSPDVIRQLNDRGIDSTPTSAAEFTRFVQEEQKKWVPIIKRSKIGVD